MSFATRIRKKAIDFSIEETDLTRIKNYQLSLIDTLLYEQPRNPNGTVNHKTRDFLYSEVQSCELWLKKNWDLFMNQDIKFDTPEIKFSKPEKAKLKGGYNRNKTF